MQINYQKELNDEQYRVVTGGDGPCLVLAGAGSGKTRTLVYRVAWLLEQGIHPQEIMLVTFTNKAAREMLNRVELLAGQEQEEGDRVASPKQKSMSDAEASAMLQ